MAIFENAILSKKVGHSPIYARFIYTSLLLNYIRYMVWYMRIDLYFRPNSPSYLYGIWLIINTIYPALHVLQLDFTRFFYIHGICYRYFIKAFSPSHLASLTKTSGGCFTSPKKVSRQGGKYFFRKLHAQNRMIIGKHLHTTTFRPIKKKITLCC